VRCYPGNPSEISNPSEGRPPQVKSDLRNFSTYLWSPDEVEMMRAVGNRRAKELTEGREDGHLKQEVFQFTIRPGNKRTEAVIVFDYRIVLGLCYLISRRLTMNLVPTRSHNVSYISDDAYRK